MSDGSHFDPGSEAELERLQLQALCVEELTCRLIRESGIRPGMRVLDLGAGPGDVAFLVAEAVGPSGSVVGVDREERSVELAKRRSAEIASLASSTARSGLGSRSGSKVSANLARFHCAMVG